MRALKPGLVIIILGLGAFSFFGVAPRAELLPLMMLALGVLLIVRGQDYKRENDRGGFLLLTAAGLFVLAVVVAQFLM